MKYILLKYVMPLCVAYSLISCGNSSHEPTLVGSWKESKFVKTNCKNIISNATILCSSECSTLTITPTSITIVRSGQSPIAYNYVISGSSITLTAGGITNAYFTLSDTVLTLQFKGDCEETTTYVRL